MKYTPPSVLELIEDIEQIQKRAQVDLTSEDVTGQDPSSIPGSENDKKTPSEMKEPDPEVVDETVGGEENYSADGAEPGSDNKQLNPQLLDSEEEVLNPERKALESTDVDAKTASAGNDIISTILKSRETAKAAKKEASAPKKGAVKTENTESETKKASQSKQAADEPIVFTGSTLEKLAAVWLSTKEGRDQCADMLAKLGGQEFASRSLQALAEKRAEANEREELYQKMAEFEKGAQDAEALINGAAEAQGAADAEALLGDAEEAQGAADAEAALAGAAGAAGGGDEGLGGEIPPDTTIDDVIAVTADLLENGEITEDQAAEVLEAAGVPMNTDVDSDELVDTFAEMVANGEIPEDVAQSVMDQIVAEGGDEGGAPEAPEAAAEAAAEEAAPEAAAEAAPPDPTAQDSAEELGAAKEAAVKKIAAAIKTASARRKAASQLSGTIMNALRQKQQKQAKAKAGK